MKILVVGPSDTKAYGGMSSVIHEIRESKLLNREFDIDIFASYIDGNILVRLLYSVLSYLQFLFFYKKYDLFHIHAASNGSTFRKYLYVKHVKKAGKKVIIHMHGADFLEFYERINNRKRKIVNNFFCQANMVLVLSESWKQEFEKRFHINNYDVLYNGVDIDKFCAAVTDAVEIRNTFLMMGRLGKRKGVYDLIKAVEIAIQKNPELTVYLAGDGEIENVRKKIRENGLEKHLIVCGWIDEAEKLVYLGKAATVVLPSYNEGLPIAILEGMAAGKAIISTTVGAIPEIVTEQNGILIKPGDINALADALLYCSRNIDMLRSMSKENIKKAKNEFNIHQMHKQLADYYRKVMQ